MKPIRHKREKAKKIIDAKITPIEPETRHDLWNQTLEGFSNMTRNDWLIPALVAGLIIAGPISLAILFMLWCLMEGEK